MTLDDEISKYVNNVYFWTPSLDPTDTETSACVENEKNRTQTKIKTFFARRIIITIIVSGTKSGNQPSRED